MSCQICGRDRVRHGSEHGAPGTYLYESGCHDGVWMDDDEYHEGWQRDVIYRPCLQNPDCCQTCEGTGDALRHDGIGCGDDCPNCRGTGWKDGEPQWPTEVEEAAEIGRFKASAATSEASRAEACRQRDAALAEVERLRAELAIAAPDGLLGPEWGRSTFARLFGQTYQPVLWGKHEATHPTVLDQALRIAGQRAPELVDVIAALVWQSGIVGNRARFAFDEVSAERARADRLDAVLRTFEWAGTTDRAHGGVEACCPRCARPKRLGRHAPECPVAVALTDGVPDGR